VVIDDAALDGPAVAAAVAPLLADPERLAAMAGAMRSQAHPDAAEELAALVVEASGRTSREEYLAEVAAAATPIDREASGWFESSAPTAGPSVQRRVDRRTKRMEAYPPIDRNARAATQAQGTKPGPAGEGRPGAGVAGSQDLGPGSTGFQDPGPGAAGDGNPDAADAQGNGYDPHPARKPDAAQGGPPPDRDAGP
jgi:hypothetical protein